MPDHARPRPGRTVGVVALAVVAVGLAAAAAAAGGPGANHTQRRDQPVRAVSTPAPTTPTGPAPRASPSATPTTTTPTVRSTPPSIPALTPARVDFRYPDFSRATGLRLNGSAHLDGGRLVLGGGRNSAGSAWSTTRIDPTRSWNSAFTMDITKLTDGIAFVVQGQSPTAIGSSGSGLGYGHRPGDRGRTITPSVAVEFDLWSNDRDGFDPPGPHVAVTSNGDVSRHLIARTPSSALFGQGPVDVVVSYNVGSHDLTVYVQVHRDLPSGALANYVVAPLFRYPIDLSTIVGADPVYVGFTGGTGLTSVADPEEAISYWSFTETPRGRASPTAR